VKVIEAFAGQHTALKITLELATLETIKRFVQERVGLAFVPRMCVREELERSILVTVTVRGLTHDRTLCAAYRRANFSPAAAAFISVLRPRRSRGLSSVTFGSKRARTCNRVSCQLIHQLGRSPLLRTLTRRFRKEYCCAYPLL